MLPRGKGGGGGRSGYVLYTVHRPSAYVIRCTCISMQGLSFKCIALCIPKFSIYIKTIIKGNAGLGILA